MLLKVVVLPVRGHVLAQSLDLDYKTNTATSVAALIDATQSAENRRKSVTGSGYSYVTQ